MKNDSVGQRIKKERERQGWTQEYMANLLGIKIGTLSGYERNYRQPDLAMITKIAQLLHVSVDYLLGNTDDPTTPEQRIESAISDDAELLEFWQELKEREDLQLLFKQVKPLPPNAIKRIIKYIKMVEDEEAMEDEY